MAKTRNPAVVMTPGLDSDQLGGTISLNCKALTRSLQATCVHLYDRHVGYVVEARCGGYDAVSIRTGALGRFNSESAAACAVVADHARG